MTRPDACLHCSRPICSKRAPAEVRALRLCHAGRGLCPTCYHDHEVREQYPPLRPELSPAEPSPERTAYVRAELDGYLLARRLRVGAPPHLPDTAPPSVRSTMALLRRQYAAGRRHVMHPAPTS